MQPTLKTEKEIPSITIEYFFGGLRVKQLTINNFSFSKQSYSVTYITEEAIILSSGSLFNIDAELGRSIANSAIEYAIIQSQLNSEAGVKILDELNTLPIVIE